MPTVLRARGFQVRIYSPPREHGPAHVHVLRGDGEMILDLNDDGETVTVRGASHMPRRDAWRAMQLVEEYAPFLREQWRKYHG